MCAFISAFWRYTAFSCILCSMMGYKLQTQYDTGVLFGFNGIAEMGWYLWLVVNLFLYHFIGKTYPLVTTTTGVSYNVQNVPPSTSASSGSGQTATTSKDKTNTTSNVPGDTATAVVKTITHVPSRANKGI